MLTGGSSMGIQGGGAFCSGGTLSWPGYSRRHVMGFQTVVFTKHFHWCRVTGRNWVAKS